MVERSTYFAGLSVVDLTTGRHLRAGTFPQKIIERALKLKEQRPFVLTETLPGGERVLLLGQAIEPWKDGSALLLALGRLNTFNELYRDNSILGTTGESFLTDSNGLALTTLRYSYHRESHPVDAAAMTDCLAGNSGSFIITPDYTGVPTAMSYRPVQSYGGCVMVHMRASEVMATVNAMRNMIIAIVATVITAVTLMSFLVGRKLLRLNNERGLLEQALAWHASQMEATVEKRTVKLKDEIKARIEAEGRLRENEAFLKNIVHNVHEAIFMVNAEQGGAFRLMWWNANVDKMLGIKPAFAAGLLLPDVFGPDTGGRLEARCSECVDTGSIDYEETFNTPNGPMVLLTTLAPVRNAAGRVVQIICSAMDITERKKLEGEMIKSQQLDSLGVLAGGIAHDFNNLLAVIRLNISILKHNASLDPESLEMIGLVENSTALAANLTNQLLTFAKGGKPVVKAVPVREFLNEVANLSLRGTKTACKLDLAEGLSDIEADRGQMTQVINNMLMNADQAMPDGGIVKLSAEEIELTGLEKGLPLKRGRYVKITIEDHGIGIPEENLSRVFDPYFTTKKKGSGLGLASSYSIIKNHNGHISVSSSAGHGTKFEILVPASATKAPSDIHDTGGALMTRTGRVLVMDDEEGVRASVRKALESLGYEVADASNGLEAVNKYREGMDNDSAFDAVILDLTVPVGMGGEEAVAKILELDPAAKVFVSSGYSNTSVIADFKRYGFCGFLKKPYDASELDRSLHAAISAQRT